MNVQQGAPVMDVVGMIRRRGKLAVVVAGVTLLGTYWVAMAMPNSYASTAMILVEPQSVSDELVRSGVRQSDLSKRLGIMTAEILSRARLTRIVDEFKLYEDQWDELTREEIIELMRGHVSVDPHYSELERGTSLSGRNPEEFNTFVISFRYTDGITAAQVANRIAKDFIDEHIDARVKVSQKSLTFMTNSMDSIAEQVREVEAQTARVKADNPGKLPEDLQSNQLIRQRIITALGTAQRELAEAEGDAAFWKGQVLAAAAMSDGYEEASPAFQLKVLELELAEYRALGFTDRHPDVIKALQKKAVLQQAVAAQENAVEEDAPLNFAQQQAEAEHRRRSLRAEGARKEVARLEQELVAIEALIAATPAVAEQLDALDREQQNLTKRYTDFSARLQEATVQADMERRQLGEQLRVLEPAFPSPAPASPNRIMLLALGLVMGALFGGVAAFGIEMADASIHTPAQLQAAMNIPVLAAIPPIMLESDRIARNRSLIKQGIAAAAVVLFCLVGGAITYYYVNGSPGAPDEATEGQAEAEQASLIPWIEEEAPGA